MQQQSEQEYKDNNLFFLRKEQNRKTIIAIIPRYACMQNSIRVNKTIQTDMKAGKQEVIFILRKCKI